MSAASTLTADNIALLHQALALLEALDDNQYLAKPLPLAPIGSHLRHCLDFYGRFVDGLGSGDIDYDQRERDHEVETLRSRAITRVLELAEVLGRIPTTMADRQVRVCSDRDCESPELGRFSRSTVRREVQFLRAHTIHHFAIIGTIARVQGIEPPVGFGVAPSTLARERVVAG